MLPLHGDLTAEEQDRFLSAGYQDIEMNWIGDFNPRMLAVTRSVAARCGGGSLRGSDRRVNGVDR